MLLTLEPGRRVEEYREGYALCDRSSDKPPVGRRRDQGRDPSHFSASSLVARVTNYMHGSVEARDLYHSSTRTRTKMLVSIRSARSVASPKRRTVIRLLVSCPRPPSKPMSLAPVGHAPSVVARPAPAAIARAGLAAPARMLASALGCRVDCLEMSPDFCAGAALLNRLTGLDDRIEVHRGSALDLPFPEDSFDVVWMQNVGMNIADKRKLYAEIYRVLKPDGRYAFQEMAAGRVATSYYPLPWATDPADNFLVSAEEMASHRRARSYAQKIHDEQRDLAHSCVGLSRSAAYTIGARVVGNDILDDMVMPRRTCAG